MTSRDAVASDQAARAVAYIKARDASLLAHPAGKGRRLDAVPDPSDFELAVTEITEGLAELLVSKQKDYGPRAIREAPGGPTLGVLVRAHDKLERLVHLTGKDSIVHESIEDSWRDLANYAIIGLLVHTGEWPT